MECKCTVITHFTMFTFNVESFLGKKMFILFADCEPKALPSLPNFGTAYHVKGEQKTPKTIHFLLLSSPLYLMIVFFDRIDFIALCWNSGALWSLVWPEGKVQSYRLLSWWETLLHSHCFSLLCGMWNRRAAVSHTKRTKRNRNALSAHRLSLSCYVDFFLLYLAYLFMFFF